MFVNMPFNKELGLFWFKICIYLLKATSGHRRCWKNFEKKSVTSDVFGSAKTTDRLTVVDSRPRSGRSRTARMERRMWYCWWPHDMFTDTLVSTWNFKEYWNSSSSVGCIIPYRACIHPEENNVPIRLLMYLFSSSVTTQLRQGVKLGIHLEARIFRMFCDKNYKHRFKLH